MEKVIERRRALRDKAILEAKGFVRCVSSIYDVVEAFLIGSFARGDFNAWSDVDVLVVVRNAPDNPIERLDKILECLKKFVDIEPIILNVEEFKKLIDKKNPIAIEAKKFGVRLLS